MPRRNSKAREAPMMSRNLSGRIKNRFGCGGLKFGEGVIGVGSFTELMETEGEEEEEEEGGSWISAETLNRRVDFGRRWRAGRSTGEALAVRITAIVFWREEGVGGVSGEFLGAV